MSRSEDFQVEAGPPLRERREVCAVMILYEDLPARALAIQLHDRLIPGFKGEIEFGFNWWRFDYLADPQIAHEAASCALRADQDVITEAIREDHDTVPGRGRGLCVIDRQPSGC